MAEMNPLPAVPVEAPIDQPASLPTPVAPPEDVGNIMFEDYFPPLKLNDDQKASIATWFLRDLKACVKNVNDQKNRWSTYRGVYMLDYIEKFYPTMGIGADYASGLLCEKVLEGLDRLSLGIFGPRPLFVVDDKTSNVEDISFIHRAEWFMHTLFMEDLDIQEALGTEGIFDFLLDGSAIVEVDQMYEKIPQRTIKTYHDVNELIADEDKILNKADFEEAMEKLMSDKLARVLVEEEVLTKNGLQVFLVDKLDHLIPPNVFNDKDVRFRARRMYLTESDLKLMASDGVGWYEKEDVEEVLNKRATDKIIYKQSLQGDTDALDADELNKRDSEYLAYNWRGEEDKLSVDENIVPYKNTFAIYRVTCKYGYKTKGDEKGLIPKFCVFDFEPESETILRARTYPHFHERPNYFHFKLGHVPDSYWGFGFGARLINDDFLESNAVSLYLDAAAMATFRPTLAIHPDEGGLIPFRDGIGPGKIGYVRNIQDVKPYEIPMPPPALISSVLPITGTRASNRTSITSLVQGRTESSDPRAPAAKANMLLQEAHVGIDALIRDWNKGWQKLANFVWASAEEMLIYEDKSVLEDKISFPGIDEELEKSNVITAEELRKKINWKSQASSDYLNAEVREQKFLREFQFFAPLLENLAAINPELYKKYFMRWMKQAAQELNIRGFKYLIPDDAEIALVTPEQVQGMMEGMLGQMQQGQSPGTTQLEGGG